LGSGTPLWGTFVSMDRCLNAWVKRLEKGTGGSLNPFTLDCLYNVMEVVATVSADYGYVADHIQKSFRICEALYREAKRGPGLKVPGSHAFPAKAGDMIEPEAVRPAPARVEVGVQTVAAITVDAAIEDLPVELAT